MATVKLIYEGKDVSRDISPLLLAFEYIDKTEGESDEISITVRNNDLVWLDSWKPIKGDTITAEIHTDNNELLQCGTFEVDECDGSGSRDAGHVFTIKALATGVKDPIRTKRSTAHENKRLSEIVKKIADRHGYTVKGITADFKIKYESQYQESDIAFLHRLSIQYGYMFSIRAKQLIFSKIDELHKTASSSILKRTECGPYTFSEKLTRIYGKGRLKRRNSKKKSLISYAKSLGLDVPSETLTINTNVDDDKQAEQITDAQLYKKQLEQVSFTLTDLKGNVYLIAGNNATLSGWGTYYDGNFTITESTHIVSRDGGYKVSSITCKKIRGL